jgi:hypothetical protein
MNKLIFNKKNNNKIIEINIPNYQDLSSNYNLDELNKRILNYILENNLENIKLSFDSILNNTVTIQKIFNIREMLLFLDVTVFSIEISFDKELKGTLLGAPIFK